MLPDFIWHVYWDPFYMHASPAALLQQSMRLHSKHHFPAPSSKLCQDQFHHWRGTLYLHAAVHWHCQRPPECLGTNKTVEATQRPSTRSAAEQGKKKEFHLDSKSFGFIRASISNVGSCKRNTWYNLSCLLQTCCNLSTTNNKNLSVSWQLFHNLRGVQLW